jgi:phosphorylcholine metabolism protein LicD
MEEQWNVICYLAEFFERHNIEYQFDVSTSVFVHGIEFLMDDIDVIVLREYKDKVKRLLSEYEQTNI